MHGKGFLAIVAAGVMGSGCISVVTTQPPGVPARPASMPTIGIAGIDVSGAEPCYIKSMNMDRYMHNNFRQDILKTLLRESDNVVNTANGNPLKLRLVFRSQSDKWTGGDSTLDAFAGAFSFFLPPLMFITQERQVDYEMTSELLDSADRRIHKDVLRGNTTGYFTGWWIGRVEARYGLLIKLAQAAACDAAGLAISNLFANADAIAVATGRAPPRPPPVPATPPAPSSATIRDVAVLDITATGLTPQQAADLANRLRTALAATEKVRVMGADYMRQALGELPTGPKDFNALGEIARRLEVQQVVHVDVVSSPAGWSSTMTTVILSPGGSRVTSTQPRTINSHNPDNLVQRWTTDVLDLRVSP